MPRSHSRPSVIITDATGWRRPGRLPPGGRWVYLGKDTTSRGAFEQAFGTARQWPLGDRLHAAAASLRQPFLDFMAAVGAGQHDPLTWWSTGLSCKKWTASDAFLLMGYLRLAGELIEEARRQRAPLVLAIEDPWLRAQLAASLRHAPDVRVDVPPGLWRVRLLALGRGPLLRAWWLGKVTAWFWLKQRRVWPRGSLVPPPRPAVALFTAPLPHCLRADGGWDDPFLPGLDRLLEAQGYDVLRFSPPQYGGMERELARRHRAFRPLILYATPGGVWRALTAFWRPVWPADCTVAGMPVRRLLEREWWIELGRATVCFERMFYECLRRLLARGEWRCVIYPYENLPPEKLIALCAKARGVRSIGVQHSALSQYYLSYFLGAGEAGRMPLPDVIWTSGSYPHRLLREGGNPPERLRMVGSIRYQHLAAVEANTRRAPRHAGVQAPLSTILVALPIDLALARHLLAAIRAAFPDGGAADGVTFVVKPHPLCRIRRELWGFPAEEAPAAMAEALARCGTVISVGSAVAPEALAMGRAVLRYRPSLLLDVDTAELYADQAPACRDETLREVVLAVARGPSRRDHVAAQGGRPAEEVFAPFAAGALQELMEPAGVGHG